MRPDNSCCPGSGSPALLRGPTLVPGGHGGCGVASKWNRAVHCQATRTAAATCTPSEAQQRLSRRWGTPPDRRVRAPRCEHGSSVCRSFDGDR